MPSVFNVLCNSTNMSVSYIDRDCVKSWGSSVDQDNTGSWPSCSWHWLVESVCKYLKSMTRFNKCKIIPNSIYDLRNKSSMWVIVIVGFFFQLRINIILGQAQSCNWASSSVNSGFEIFQVARSEEVREHDQSLSDTFWLELGQVSSLLTSGSVSPWCSHREGESQVPLGASHSIRIGVVE